MGIEAAAAVDGPAVSRNEGHSRGFPAARARNFRVGFCSGTGQPAASACFRRVLKLLLMEEHLLSGAEDEELVADAALDLLIGELHIEPFWPKPQLTQAHGMHLRA